MSPALANLLAGIAAGPSRIAALTTYRARCGERRDFQSASDADAYDRGWSTYPAPLADVVGTPAMRGWFDAEALDMERLEARLDNDDDWSDE